VKRTASILLLTILAFNWVGYRFLSGFLEHKADLALENKIENADYDETRLIELRVPLNAPYLAGNSSEYERFDGEVEIDGIHYKYVKRKVVNGELVLLCLPNDSKTEFQNSRMDFFKMVNDLNNPSQNKKNTSTVKTFTAEYKQENNSWSLVAIYISTTTPVATGSSNIAEGYNTLPDQPPRA
jgi:hypothetical protein